MEPDQDGPRAYRNGQVRIRGRILLASRSLRDNGTPAGHWISVLTFSTAIRTFPLSNRAIWKASFSASDLKLSGSLDVGDRTVKLYPAITSCLIPDTIPLSRRGDMMTI